jgi:hypothetical protein
MHTTATLGATGNSELKAQQRLWFRWRSVGIFGGTWTAQKCPVLLGLLHAGSLVAAVSQQGLRDPTRIELDG